MSGSHARRALVLSLALALVAALALPSIAKPGKSKGKTKGKRSIGTVMAFDAGTMELSVEFRDGSSWDGPVGDNAKIKLEHRGKPAQKGNPTRGSVDDIDVGDEVLKMKVRGGEVHKLRLRDVNSDVEDANGGECKDEEEEPSPEGEEEEVVEEEEDGDGEETLSAMEGDGEDEVVVDENEVEEETDGDDDKTCADKVDKGDDGDEGDEEPEEEGEPAPEGDVVEEEVV